MNKQNDSFLEPIFKGLTKMLLVATGCIVFVVLVIDSDFTYHKKRSSSLEKMAVWKMVARVVKK